MNGHPISSIQPGYIPTRVSTPPDPMQGSPQMGPGGEGMGWRKGGDSHMGIYGMLYIY